MILLYHKVDLEAKTAYWVTADTFYKQMLALQAYDVVSLATLLLLLTVFTKTCSCTLSLFSSNLVIHLSCLSLALA